MVALYYHAVGNQRSVSNLFHIVMHINTFIRFTNLRLCLGTIHAAITFLQYSFPIYNRILILRVIEIYQNDGHVHKIQNPIQLDPVLGGLCCK